MRATREARRTGGCTGARSDAVRSAARVNDPLLHPPRAADAFDISGTSVSSLQNFLAPTPDVLPPSALHPPPLPAMTPHAALNRHLVQWIYPAIKCR